MTVPIQQQLAALLGADSVLAAAAGGAAELAGYAVDEVMPLAVARPADRAEVAAVVQWAAAHRVAVLPWGGGVHRGLGNPPHRAGVALDLSRLNRVLDYQPADLTATVEGGITLAGMQRGLAGGGKFVPLESPIAERATVGGILAANSSGPLRYSYGLPRDWLIGVSIIGGDGIETKAGGRVVKNVTGYDLNKLYIGSLGTLGVIVEATFKLSPRPDTGAVLTAAFPALDAGIAAGRSLISQVYAPQGVQVINRPAARRLGIDNANPTAAAYLVAFFAGRPRAVARRREESARLLRDAGVGNVETLDAAAGQSLLQRLTDLGWYDDTLPALGLKVNLPAAAVGEMAAYGEATGHGEDWGIVADVGFGTVHLLRWDERAADDATIADTIAEIAAIRERAHALGGTVVVEHCPLAVKASIDVWGGGAALEQELAIMRRIKDKFDPAGILNPGRFMGGL